MKKMILTALVAVASLAANAQVWVGGEVGFSATKTTIDGDKQGAAAAFNLLPEIGYTLNDKFDIALTIGLSHKNSNGKYNLEYINVPVMAKFYVTKGLSLNAGLQVGFMTKAKVKGDGTNVDIKSICNKADFSIPLSIAYEFENGLSFEARYTGGLTNVIKESAIKEAGLKYDIEKDNKNEVFMLTVGYKFSL